MNQQRPDQEEKVEPQERKRPSLRLVYTGAVEVLVLGVVRNLSTTLRQWRLRFTEQFLLLWVSQVG